MTRRKRNLLRRVMTLISKLEELKDHASVAMVEPPDGLENFKQSCVNWHMANGED